MHALLATGTGTNEAQEKIMCGFQSSNIWVEMLGGVGVLVPVLVIHIHTSHTCRSKMRAAVAAQSRSVSVQGKMYLIECVSAGAGAGAGAGARAQSSFFPLTLYSSKLPSFPLHPFSRPFSPDQAPKQRPGHDTEYLLPDVGGCAVI
jgi:hypothetical protein